jgi:ribosomal protein L18
VLSEAEIRKYVESVRKELPKCKVASAYIQAYRIAEKAIKEKVDNKFFGAGGSIHSNVRTDFYETDSGLV